MKIDSLLKPFHSFGVNLGLERIKRLLSDLGNPQEKVPIIHVAGSNGKGSVCAYLSAILTAAGYQVGRYTSPHLMNWNERICLREKPISNRELATILQEIQTKIKPGQESPTQFEVITAAAWLYFAESQADIAVMEVGLGGRLDATNVCNHPLVSVITSLSLEHRQNLGPTLSDIAREKAGILKANCPAVIGKLPSEAATVVATKIQELNCPSIWVEPARELPPRNGLRWAKYGEIEYPLPLLGEMQLINSALAIASIQILQAQGWQISSEAVSTGIANTKWLGRLQWTKWQNQQLLVDGAHNPAAAVELRKYVDSLQNPVTWVMGMLATKDHGDIFRALLRPGDRLYLVPVPDHSTAEPEYLATLAQNICPSLAASQSFPELFLALEKAFVDNFPVILSGSLYLLGYFFQHLKD